jgi:hypothetical protein
MLVCGYGLTRLKRIQKLTLYGRYPGAGSKRLGTGMDAYEDEASGVGRLKRWRMRLRGKGYRGDM